MLNSTYLEDDELMDDNDEFIVPELSDDQNDTGISDESPEKEEEDSYNVDVSKMEGITSYELELTKAYDSISKSSDIVDAVTQIVMANPQHTNSNTVSNIVKEIFSKQGHNRLQNNYSTGLLRGYEVDSELDENDNGEFNIEYAAEYKDLIARFIDYLANRDMSEDNLANIRRKQRHIPAFLIFLFSNGMYDFVIDCPTLPDDYKAQVKEALRKLNESKNELVEELAEEYDKAGRSEVAERVRTVGLSWFDKEPAEILTSAEYRDLKLTQDDVDIYKNIRPKFINVSSSITQEVASELIEVVIDPEAGISEKLKDKVRTEAVNDVKALFIKFSRDNEKDSQLSKRIIFK